jgi:hypothetical protein
MNIERFYAIIAAVLEDTKQYNYPAKIAELAGSLQNRINDPTNPSYATIADATVTELREKLAATRSNSFSPSWKEYLREYGFENMIGEVLLSHLDSILTANNVTPTIAVKEINSIAAKLAGDVRQFEVIADAFRSFNFSKDEPNPGQAEMGVVIPRAAVHNGLSEFGKELAFISRIVKVFQEIETGSREDPKINSISSSDLSVFFQLDPDTAWRIFGVIKELTAYYGQILTRLFRWFNMQMA